LPFDLAEEFSDVNARLTLLIERAKKFLGNDVLSVSEYVQLDNDLPVLNPQTDEEIVDEVNKVCERRAKLEAVVLGVGAKSDKTQQSDGTAEKKTETKNDPVMESRSGDGGSNDGVSFSELVPLISAVVKDVLKRKEKKKSEPILPPNQKTLEFFFSLKKK
jgi:hypothetical protein